MRRIIASVNTTLDGFMEDPNGEGDLGWLMPFVPDGLADNARLLGKETDAILLGRDTYLRGVGRTVELAFVEAKPGPAGAVSLTY